jgi:ribosomal protein S27E
MAGLFLSLMALDTYMVPPGDDRVTIVCLYCEKSQEVSRKAMTVTCRYCNKSLISGTAGDRYLRRGDGGKKGACGGRQNPLRGIDRSGETQG